MDKLTQQASNFYIYMDRITKPTDILWHIFCRYTGQILIITGVLTFNPQVITLGVLMFVIFQKS